MPHGHVKRWSIKHRVSESVKSFKPINLDHRFEHFWIKILWPDFLYCKLSSFRFASFCMNKMKNLIYCGGGNETFKTTINTLQKKKKSLQETSSQSYFYKIQHHAPDEVCTLMVLLTMSEVRAESQQKQKWKQPGHQRTFGNRFQQLGHECVHLQPKLCPPHTPAALSPLLLHTDGLAERDREREKGGGGGGGGGGEGRVLLLLTVSHTQTYRHAQIVSPL